MAKATQGVEEKDTLQHFTREEKHQQCLKEIKGTLIVVLLCAVWHILTAFLLNGTGLYFLGVPAWYSVSTLGTVLIALGGIWYLLKYVFKDFSYDDEEEVSDVQ